MHNAPTEFALGGAAMLRLSASARTGNFSTDTQLYERSVGSTNLVLDYWWVGALGLLALALFLVFRGSRNQVTLLDQRCKVAFADIDALLAERHALVPNLVKIAQQHLVENRDMLDKLLDAQAEALEALGEIRMKAETRLGDAINSVVNIAAQTPQLSHSDVFASLRTDLTRIEEKITAGRRFYNLAVGEYDAVRRGVITRLWAPRDAGDHPLFTVGERREELSERIAVSFG